MTSLFQKLANYDRDVYLCNSNGVVLKIDIHKSDDLIQIECVTPNSDEFIRNDIVLFKIQNKMNNAFLSHDQLEELLFDSMDSIQMCHRCSAVYIGREVNENCAVCQLETKYILSRPQHKIECALCDQIFFKWCSKKITCCNKDDLRICLKCSEKLNEGFCPYCRYPIQLN